MQAKEINLLKFLGNTHQFIVPIYQRKYDWTIEQCRQLWDDILRVGSNENQNSHFIGSIVYIESGNFAIAKVPKLLLIDGQQRLTTVSLLIKAISEIIDKENGTLLASFYLINKDASEDDKLKLSLSKMDKEKYEQIINGFQPSSSNSRIMDNLNFFIDLLKKNDPIVIQKGLSKLEIVDISLNSKFDNPQLIFESMNSTGLDLKQNDLIRNFLLMNLEPEIQKSVYEKYWFPLESIFSKQEDKDDRFDRFIRDWLTIKTQTREISNLFDIYTNFKKYIRSNNNENVMDIVKNIFQYGQLYEKIIYQTGCDDEIKTVLRDIKTYRMEVAYPFMLELYNDFENNIISRDDFISCSRTIESYTLRRQVCGYQTAGQNRMFASLYPRLDKSNLKESLLGWFFTRDSYFSYPTDEEFSLSLKTKDIYNSRIAEYLLQRIEREMEGKQQIDFRNKWTIEHIMPQNLNDEWRKILGDNAVETHNKYLHTLGNLTITFHNSEMGNKSFQEKKESDKGFKASKLSLSENLLTLDYWNEQAIIKRAELLSKIALEIWPRHSISEEKLNLHRNKFALEKKEKKTVEDMFTDSQIILKEIFIELRERLITEDSSLTEDYGKTRMSFHKNGLSFLSVKPLTDRLRLRIWNDSITLDDPKNICEKSYMELKNKKRYFSQLYIDSTMEIDYLLYLIKQALIQNS